MIKPFILCYHQIETDEFDAQLTALKKRFEIVSLKTFESRIRQKKMGAYCALTLDDCLAEDIEKAVAVCRRHNLPITLFLPVGFSLTNAALPGTWVQKLLQKRTDFVFNGEKIHVTPQNRLAVKQKINNHFSAVQMKTDEMDKQVRAWYAENNLKEEDIITDAHKVIPTETVQELSKEDIFSFQSHTYNHEGLGLCTPAEIEDEFSKSKKILEEITGKEVFAICYPYGSKQIIGNKIFGFVSKYYTCGFSLIQGVCTKKTDIYFMPRIGMYPGDTLSSFWGKIYHQMQANFLKFR